MQRKDIELVLALLLAVTCLIACALFTYLPIQVFDTGLVYQGF